MLDAYFLATPAFAYLKDLTEAGELGELFAVNIDFSMPLFNRMMSSYPYRWTGYAASGASILRNNGAHALNTILGLFGEVQAVVAQTALSVKQWNFEDGGSQIPEVPDTATLMFKLKNGAVGSMHLGRAVPSGAGFRLEAYGSKARIRAESWHYPHDRTTKLSIATPIRIYEETSERVLETPAAYFSAPGASCEHPLSITMGRMCAAFLRARQGDGEVEPDFARGLAIQQIVEAAEASERTQAWVEVETA
jgi:predicted dehydrogenase